LCIRRTLAEGRAVGLASGLGAATADAAYGAVAGFGLTAISAALVGQRFWFSLLGGLFLCYLGIRTLLTQPAHESASVQGRGLVGAYTSTLFLTLTNPTTILSFVAIFAGLGLGAQGDYVAAGILVLGVFLGSGLWWLALSFGVSLFRARFDARAMRWVNRLSGVVILGFGIWALGSWLMT
jgi:threonine/homoserine/homoserine lactone efflux protein